MTEANGYLLGLIGEFVDEGDFEKQKRFYLKKHYQTVPLIKGVKTILAERNQQGFQLHAVTANYADLARAGLAAHDLLANFVTVCSSLEGENGNKDFEFYRQVLDHEKLGAQDVLMVEDSLPNLQIAQKLGIQGLYFENDIFPRNNKAFPFISIESLLQLRQYLEVKND